VVSDLVRDEIERHGARIVALVQPIQHAFGVPQRRLIDIAGPRLLSSRRRIARKFQLLCADQFVEVAHTKLRHFRFDRWPGCDHRCDRFFEFRFARLRCRSMAEIFLKRFPKGLCGVAILIEAGNKAEPEMLLPEGGEFHADYFISVALPEWSKSFQELDGLLSIPIGF
jgi:hypothetical protein